MRRDLEERLGQFNVYRVELTEALRAFTRRSAGADVSLVFYAGHGIEMDGVNRPLCRQPPEVGAVCVNAHVRI